MRRRTGLELDGDALMAYKLLYDDLPELYKVTNNYIDHSVSFHTTTYNINTHQGGRHGHRRDNRNGERKSRKPKLYNYCASCGTVDADVAAGMSSGRLCEEGFKTCGYAARELGHTARHMARTTGGLVRDLGSMAYHTCGLIAALFK